MIQSEESKKLQEYAKTTDRTYPDFVTMIGFVPQVDGFDKELWEFVERTKPNYDQLMQKYMELSGALE